MTKSNLELYICLTSKMLKLDDIDERRADFIRDKMDAVWYNLSAFELELLNFGMQDLVEIYEKYQIKQSLNSLF